MACEIHPLNNLRVLKYLVNELEVDDDAKFAWYRHWIHQGFAALETMLSREAGSGDFCHGDAPTLADVCLVPQVFNAERFECDLSAYPRIRRITENARALDAFRLAAPRRAARCKLSYNERSKKARHPRRTPAVRVASPRWLDPSGASGRPRR